MSNPLLSIILPVYNGISYLPSAVASIALHNEALDYELLLIDDGSTDDSLIECHRLAVADTHIRVFHKQNGGIASARNYGLQQSLGQYVTFFDQDDFCISAYLPFLQQMTEKHSDILIADYHQGTVEQHVRQKHIKNTLSGDSMYAQSIVRTLVSPRFLCTLSERSQLPTFFGTIWNCIFRSSFIQSNHIEVRSFFDFEDDWVFCVDALSRADCVATSESSFYCHVINEGSETFRHKYIPHFPSGRDSLWQWLQERLSLIGIDSDKIDSARNEYRKDTVLWGFYNSCNLSLTQYIESMRSREQAFVDCFRLSHYATGIVEWAFLMLIGCRFYRIAYLFNTKVFNLNYH